MHSVQHQTLEAKPVSATSAAIARRLAQHQQDVRALLALSLVSGAPIAPMSCRRAALMANASRYRIASAALATPGEIESLLAGRLRLRDVRRAHSLKAMMTDSEIDALIDRIGADRLLEALDRVTTPASLAIAAE
jgi:hypothetical protein